MKKFYLFFFSILLFSAADAQIINFPDPALKAKLLSSSPTNFVASADGEYVQLDENNDGEIEVSETVGITDLNLQNASITNASGLEHFSSVSFLRLSNNNLTSFVLGNMPVIMLYLDHNQLTNVDLNGAIWFHEMHLEYNQLSNFEFHNASHYAVRLYLQHNVLTDVTLSGEEEFFEVDFSHNQLTSLDLSASRHGDIHIGDNPITYLNIKNGDTHEVVMYNYLPQTLQYVCVDDNQNTTTNIPPSVQVNSYCSFTPGGTFYTIAGNNQFDSSSNGCDATDNALPNLKFNITNGATSGTIISNSSGAYSVPVQQGTHTITPVIEHPSYFTISPASATVSFPSQASPVSQPFCITPSGMHPDLEILLFDMSQAAPGFDAYYMVTLKNNGNQNQSGTFNVTFDDNVADFISSFSGMTTVSPGVLQGSFANLSPFQTSSHAFMININSPMETPAVNDGHILTFTAAVNPAIADETPSDNTFTLVQTVVNSYDPNDKTCLEGATIPLSMVGEYVHYKIRFENTGSAAAENIVVRDMIDMSKYEVATLIPIASSHPVVTRVTADKIEFIFENIMLPFDDANNDGFIAFKIKTKPNLLVGNTFSNTASIYFDYNFPILTNTASTTVTALANADFDFASEFSVYPNPANGALKVRSLNAVPINTISIYNILGQQVIVVPNAKEVTAVDVSDLRAGTYFIQIDSDTGKSATKFIKN
ncbi:MAG TPA: T9SS type A sorting domain-containing protein [Flavobacterium sp.]|jgi:uncharacterized protein YjbI with pentapeptide repeats